MTIQRKVLIAFLVCTLGVARFTLFKPRVTQLKLEMNSSTSSLAQVFYDVGKGFNEGDSRTANVSANAAGEFQHLTFELPNVTIYALRFDPLTTEGRFTIRSIQIQTPKDILKRFSDDDIQDLNQIALHKKLTHGVEFATTPGAQDPGLTLQLHAPFRGKRITPQNLFSFLRGIVMLIALGCASLWLLLRSRLQTLIHSIDSRLNAVGEKLSSEYFLKVDSLALWFLAGCLLIFLATGVCNLNGSSIGMYSAGAGHGARVKPILGDPRAIRSDEWGYQTPDVLNEALRADRFATVHSPLGAHSAALLGNVPLRHFSTIFRPQFWSFFILPTDHAFAFFWYSKALILVTGVFTWLLLMTRSSAWSITGALWFFFSPSTQWEYSWPSALPVIIGSLCLGVVFFCYLVVGRNLRGLLLAVLGAIVFLVDFAMCFYLPHMVPVFWVVVLVSIAWCLAQRKYIFDKTLSGTRLLAIGIVLAIIGSVGALVYIELQPALAAIAHTAYPGQRRLAGGEMHIWELGSHFMPWFESEDVFPITLGNICEGSGFLWLAPVTLLFIGRIKFSRLQTFVLIALWLVFLGLLAWFVLPIPASIGQLFGLDRVQAARGIPALGLANVAIVVISMSAVRSAWIKSKLVSGALVTAAFAVFWVTLRSSSAHLGGFFSNKEVFLSATFTTLLVFFIIRAKKLWLSLALIVPELLVSGTANPVQQGISVITSSELFAFVHTHPALLEGQWMIFSDSPITSGFFAAVGCQPYTGTRYVPDIDHFNLLAARGLDPGIFNRLGYLDAHAIEAITPSTATLESPVVIRWNIAPADPLLKAVGIRYAAFDQPPSPAWVSHLTPLSEKPVDGFWLYRVQ